VTDRAAAHTIPQAIAANTYSADPILNVKECKQQKSKQRISHKDFKRKRKVGVHLAKIVHAHAFTSILCV